MINNKKLLALIPARKGSKRLPHKNKRELAGKPLLVWSIDAALQAKAVDRVIVSTDDEQIAQLASDYGADTPFLRPAELSGDQASSLDVVLHALDYLQHAGEAYDYLLLLQPTSPLREAKHIKEAVELFKQKQAAAVIGVTALGHPPEWSNSLDESLSMDGFLSNEVRDKRSQDFDTKYRVNGAIYLLDVDQIKKQQSLFPEKGSYAYIMDAQSSVDIDTQNDFDFAELLLKKRQNQ